MTTELETLLADLNGNVFLGEYTFAANQFRSATRQEYELADHVVLLPGAVLAFQAKERSPNADTSEDAVVKWFKREVEKSACRQLADTKHFFETEPDLSLPNRRGHVHDLSGPDAGIIQVALYSVAQDPPAYVKLKTHRLSTKAGFVHILSLDDYREVCRVLALPSEIAAYFAFRQDLLLRLKDWNHGEAALVAAFINEDASGRYDSNEMRRTIEDALHDNESFDVGKMLIEFGDRVFYVEGQGQGTEYYAILDEFMWMNRVQMRSFRKLRDWALEKAGGEDPEMPARMLVPARGTGFVVFPVPDGQFDKRITALKNYTMAAKYDCKLDRQIGVAVSRIGDEIEIDWMMANYPWEPDAEMDRRLEANYPFRPKPAERLDYRYRRRSP
ncbi:MAG: hypothetical protein R2826_01540 [Thermoleophilia bacterium]